MDTPHVTQRLHHRHVAGLRRHVRRVQGFKQDEPIAADLQGEGFTVLPALGQAVVLNPAPIPFEPVRTGDPAQPVGCHSGQVVQCGAQCFADQLKQVQVLARLSNSGNAMRQEGDLESAPVTVTLPAKTPVELVIGKP